MSTNPQWRCPKWTSVFLMSQTWYLSALGLKYCSAPLYPSTSLGSSPLLYFNTPIYSTNYLLKLIYILLYNHENLFSHLGVYILYNNSNYLLKRCKYVPHFWRFCILSDISQVLLSSSNWKSQIHFIVNWLDTFLTNIWSWLTETEWVH